ncbi:14796_t:CDS:1, partial [Racocetra fulgida]
ITNIDLMFDLIKKIALHARITNIDSRNIIFGNQRLRCIGNNIIALVNRKLSILRIVILRIAIILRIDILRIGILRIGILKIGILRIGILRIGILRIGILRM